MKDELTEALHRQFAAADASMRVDRRGWTDDQWIADADRLMNEADGAITSLVNGHVIALLRQHAVLAAKVAAVEALPAAWERAALGSTSDVRAMALNDCADDLRAALDTPEGEK